MVKLLLWPLALAATAVKAYRWLMNAHIDWDLPFEDVEDYRWRN